jgi:hypothetical protein
MRGPNKSKKDSESANGSRPSSPKSHIPSIAGSNKDRVSEVKSTSTGLEQLAKPIQKCNSMPAIPYKMEKTAPLENPHQTGPYLGTNIYNGDVSRIFGSESSGASLGTVDHGPFRSEEIDALFTFAPQQRSHSNSTSSNSSGLDSIAIAESRMGGPLSHLSIPGNGFQWPLVDSPSPFTYGTADVGGNGFGPACVVFKPVLFTRLGRLRLLSADLRATYRLQSLPSRLQVWTAISK